MDAVPGTRGTDRRKFHWFALAAATCLLTTGAVQAATIVTDHVVSQSRQAQTDIPVTFGQVFKAGTVAKGASVTATVDGRVVPLQVDVKATNADGSLRHAVLTTVVPKLAGGANEPLALAVAVPAATRPPVTLAQVLATPFNATASLDIGGEVYTASARALLEAAESANDCKPGGTTCNVWLAGPLVGEWIVRGAARTTSGTVNPNLDVSFNVRAYAGPTPGSIAYMRTNIVIENTRAFSPQAQPQYTATLTSGSAHYTSPALIQYAYTRWHRVLWWNDIEPRVYLRQDTQYIQDSMAVSKYAQLHPDASFLAKLRQSCAPLDHCDQTQHMGNAGAQPAIGPLPRWTSVYIVDPDVRAYNWMLANTDALGAYSVHYRDQATGWPLSTRKHPNVTIYNWSHAKDVAHGNTASAADYRRDLLPTCVNNLVVQKCDHPWYSTGNPNAWDNAHQPAASYVAYMVTGSYYYMEELAFYGSMNVLATNETYRGFSKGLVGRAWGQVRGKAWVLRQLVNAAWLLPDDYPLKAEFNADVNNSIADLNATYTNNPDANPLGLMTGGAVYSTKGGKNNAMAPWQHSFLTWSAGHAAELGFAGAAQFRDWLAKFELGLMTGWKSDPTHGFCWLLASTYTAQVKDAAGHWLPDYTAVYAATFPSLVGLQCNSPEMVAALGKLQKRPWRLGQMSGYPDSATGFPANLQIGLAAAVDSGLPGAALAWKTFESRSIKPAPPHGYNNYPNFAVMPRDASGSTPAHP
ncbi:MAG TPA: hypothetical protein VFJ87_05555 [Rhodanobacteraceae bacterium]|nr:hypothetical protein [Rhodanobacteraceae bacterium]